MKRRCIRNGELAETETQSHTGFENETVKWTWIDHQHTSTPNAGTTIFASCCLTLAISSQGGFPCFLASQRRNHYFLQNAGTVNLFSIYVQGMAVMILVVVELSFQNVWCLHDQEDKFGTCCSGALYSKYSDCIPARSLLCCYSWYGILSQATRQPLSWYEFTTFLLYLWPLTGLIHCLGCF